MSDMLAWGNIAPGGSEVVNGFAPFFAWIAGILIASWAVGLFITSVRSGASSSGSRRVGVPRRYSRTGSSGTRGGFSGSGRGVNLGGVRDFVNGVREHNRQVAMQEGLKRDLANGDARYDS